MTFVVSGPRLYVHLVFGCMIINILYIMKLRPPSQGTMSQL